MRQRRRSFSPFSVAALSLLCRTFCANLCIKRFFYFHSFAFFALFHFVPCLRVSAVGKISFASFIFHIVDRRSSLALQVLFLFLFLVSFVSNLKQLRLIFRFGFACVANRIKLNWSPSRDRSSSKRERKRRNEEKKNSNWKRVASFFVSSHEKCERCIKPSIVVTDEEQRETTNVCNLFKSIENDDDDSTTERMMCFKCTEKRRHTNSPRLFYVFFFFIELFLSSHCFYIYFFLCVRSLQARKLAADEMQFLCENGSTWISKIEMKQNWVVDRGNKQKFQSTQFSLFLAREQMLIFFPLLLSSPIS